LADAMPPTVRSTPVAQNKILKYDMSGFDHDGARRVDEDTMRAEATNVTPEIIEGVGPIDIGRNQHPPDTSAE
jgi:hypothetical protein